MTIKGKDLMLFVAGKSIALATSHTMTVDGDIKEITNKDSGGNWTENELNMLSWSGLSENLYAITGEEGLLYDDLFEYMINGTAITVIMGVKGGTTDTPPSGGWTPDTTTSGVIYYTGKILIKSLQLNAPSGSDKATYTVQYTGTGALTKVPVTA